MSNFPSTVAFRKSEVVPDIEKVEQLRNCTFVGDFCLKNGSGAFIPHTVAVFWQENPPVEGYSNYFALFFQNGQTYITSGASAVEDPITALVTPAGEVVYSRDRWDCRQAETASFMIDGGRDYVRIVGDIGQSRWATLTFDGPTINVNYQEQA